MAAIKGIYTAVGKTGSEPNNGTLTIQQNGETVGTFSANQATDETINIQAAEQVQSDWGQTDSTQPDYIKNKPTIQTFVNLGAYDFTTKLFSNTVDFSTLPLGTLITFKYNNFWQVGVLAIDNNKFEIRCVLNGINTNFGLNDSNSDTMIMKCDDTVANYSTNSTFTTWWFSFRINADNHVSRSSATNTKTNYDSKVQNRTLKVGFADYLTDTQQIAFPTANNQYKTVETRKPFKVIDGGTADTKNIEYCTQAEYDSMTPDPDTLYYIWG